jgi:hypothetical protein
MCYRSMAYYATGRAVPSLARDCMQHPSPAHGVGMRPLPTDSDERTRWEGAPDGHNVLCFHGVPANNVEVKKEGAYFGQRLYLCGAEDDKCEVFLQDADLSNPTCKCGVHTRSNVVKKAGDNNGRSFLACGARKCKFFKWLS